MNQIKCKRQFQSGDPAIGWQQRQTSTEKVRHSTYFILAGCQLPIFTIFSCLSTKITQNKSKKWKYYIKYYYVNTIIEYK